MSRSSQFLVTFAILTASAFAESGAPPPPESAEVESYGSWGFDAEGMDRSVEAGDDFFRHANGTWLDEHEIPAERTGTGVWLVVHERAQERVKGIIEELAAKEAPEGTPEQKVGDYYASWMDVETLDGTGIEPLKPDLDRIAGLDSIEDLTREFGREPFVGGVSPFAAGTGIDPENPDRYDYNVGLGGMGLPDRDYYLEDSERFIGIREAYQAHIAEMLGFAEVEGAAEQAKAVLELETELARLQWPRARRRDRDATFNPTSLADLKKAHPGFDWDLFLSSRGIEALEQINVSHPDLIGPLIELVSKTSLQTWKAYLTYHLISNNAAVLSTTIDDANFAFYGKTLAGQEEQLARWKRGVGRVASKEGLGEALGQIYVKRYFPESSKKKMDELVENLRKAYGERIDGLTWMGEETKKEARAKLASFRPKIGYPSSWLDLDPISIDRKDLFGNARRITRFFTEYDNDRLKRPTDKDEWFMMPQTVNAYYNPSFNEIVFPAAILEPPFFDPDADPAINYGAIGAIIGHEMGHGFDDQGSKSDSRGVKRNWWTDEDRKAFEERTANLAAQYSAYEAVPGHKVDGKFTLGENIGDLGGVSVALHAYRLSLGGKEAPVLDGYTGVQRFFLGYAQAWRKKNRDEATIRRLKSDPHSPAKFRVNGVLRNVDDWYAAFGIEADDALYLPPEERVHIW